MARDIDDPTKTCTYLPPDESDEDSSVAPSSPVQWRDIPDGYELRLRVYKAAWTKCLNRVQSIVRSLYASVTAEVVDQVKHAYTDALPGLPHSEIPVIAVSAEPGSSSMYMEIIRQLDEPTSEEAASENSLSGGLARQIHLHPADCSNVLSVMKAIVMGFVEQSDDSLKRKPTASLANYDLNLLEAWYDVLGHRPKLVVFLHDFEQFDPGIVQDVFYICSMHIRRLPLVFLLALSSPWTPSYLHAAYSRSTLALLRVRIFTAPSGPAIVEQIITETFFDPNFEPDVMLGPATLDFIADFSSRHSPSLDAIFTLLQIAHLKHFEEPLTVLVHFAADTNLPPSAPRQFFDVLHARLYSGSNPRSLPECGIPGISEAIRTARLRFRQKACRMCMALCVARIVRRVAFGHPGHATKRRRPEGGVDELQFLSAALRGRASREVRYLGMIVKKLSALKLHALLRQLVEVFDSLEDPARREEEDTRIWVMGVMAQMPDSGDAIVDVSSEPEEGSEDVAGAKTSAVASLAAGVSEWFVQYLEERFVRLDKGPLWDIWYTGSTPYPSELINPAPRATIVSALLHPYEYAHAYRALLLGAREHTADQGGTDDIRETDGKDLARAPPALRELPDTSILFRRYMEAGRMINVYDWFQSFAVVLESQRRHQRRLKDAQATRGDAPLVSEIGQGKERMTEVDEGEEDVMDVEDGDETDDDGEDWKVQVQARFIRALHELDYMGFIKHTGRKADHVVRTIYDVAD